MKPVPDLTGAQWHGSPGDGSTSSVQVAFVDDVIVMRDSKHPDGPVLVFTKAEWDAFVAGAKDNEFDLPL